MGKYSRAAVATLYTLAGLLFVFYIAFGILAVSPLYEVLAMLASCISIYAGSLLLIKKSADTEKTMKITFAIFFALYILLLGNLLFFNEFFGRSGFSSKEGAEIGLRLTPFSTITSFLKSIKTGGHSVQMIVTNLLGNLLAFMPFSLFLPLFAKPLRSPLPFLCTTAGIIISAELIQLIFKTGVCDIDDLILNLAGAALAFIILKLKPIKKLFIKFTKIEY